MNDVHSEIRDVFRRASEGDRDALGILLEKHRAYLKILTQRHLDRRLEARFDASDVVQQTCVSVIRDFKRFAGSSEAEFLAWLRKIHERNVQDAIRDHAMAEKRCKRRRESAAGGGAEELCGTFLNCLSR